jgi:transcriptional regulator with XRE-family HTH domain
MSNKYSEALAAFLKSNSISQAKFARQVESSQPTICHYAQGVKLPRKAVARKIDEATNGQVPFNLWQIVAIERADIY